MAMQTDREQMVPILNLRTSPAVFVHRASGDAYRWERYPTVGAVQDVPRRVASDPYMRRAISRGIFQMLSEQEAVEINEKLVIPEEADQGRNSIMAALGENASEKLASRYADPDNLEDYGHETGSFTAEQILGKDRGNLPTRPQSRRRTTRTRPEAQVSEVGPPKVIVEPLMREGDLTPDTQ